MRSMMNEIEKNNDDEVFEDDGVELEDWKYFLTIWFLFIFFKNYWVFAAIKNDALYVGRP